MDLNERIRLLEESIEQLEESMPLETQREIKRLKEDLKTILISNNIFETSKYSRIVIAPKEELDLAAITNDEELLNIIKEKGYTKWTKEVQKITPKKRRK